MGSLEEKRASVRIRYAHPVSFKVLGQSGEAPNQELLIGDGVDLSNGGLCIRAGGHVLPVGSVLRTRIEFSETGVTIPVLTQVRWVKEEQPGAYQIGLRFLF